MRTKHTPPPPENIKDPLADRLLVTRAEAARRYGMSIRSLDTLIREGIVPKITLGEKFVRVPVREADKALLEMATGGRRSA